MTDPTPAPDNLVPKDAVMDSVRRYCQEIRRAADFMEQAAIEQGTLRIDLLGQIEGKVARIKKLLRINVSYGK